MLIKQRVLAGWGPGGWQFHQPETGWEAPNPTGTTFQQQVQNIIKHRLGNPGLKLSTDPIEVAQELEAFTIARWRRTYHERGIQKFLEADSTGYDDVIKKKSTVSTPSRRSLFGKVAALVGVDSTVVEEWLGAGGTAVQAARAADRAKVCVGCKDGNQAVGWRDALTAGAALALREYLSVKNAMNLHTEFDGAIGVCRACKCYLPLKVWTPIEHIHEDLTDEQRDRMKKLNPSCWVLTEK